MSTNGNNLKSSVTAHDDNFQQLFREFIFHSLKSLDNTEAKIDDLSKTGSKKIISSLFKTVQTISGLSDLLGFDIIYRLTNEVKILLDSLYRKDAVLAKDFIILIKDIFHFLRNSIIKVSNTENSDNDLEIEAKILIEIIKNENEKIRRIKSAIDLKPSKSLFDNKKFDAGKRPGVKIEQEWLEKFITSSADHLVSMEKNLLALENDLKNTELISDAFRHIHSLKGNSGILGLNEIEQLGMEIESILDEARNNNNPLDSKKISFMLNRIDGLSKKVNQLSMSNFQNKVEKNMETKKEPEIIIDLSAPLNEHLFQKEKAVSDQIDEKSTPEKKLAPKSQNLTAETIQQKDIRVDTLKLDKLFDLVGELITAEVMVRTSPDLKGLKLPYFTKSAKFLHKITRELQEITMSVLMMPLEGLFNRMRRLVRDLAIKSGKSIDFEVTGQDTEMDKNVIEEISDPLVHILRNAIDHGIEPAQERISKNKPESGKISLSARYEGNEILIIIKDDGKGLNKEKILEKALMKNLIKSSTDTLTDDQIFNFIFEPGFSTADIVTEISGRGVGMDVVRRNIEKIKGRIDIESEWGSGTKFTLRIPLTLAIMDSMLIRLGIDLYALPTLSIRQSFRPKKSDISITMDGLEMVKVRDVVFPVIRLHEIFNKKTNVTELDKGTLILVESKNKKACLFVDGIYGQQQVVVKGLSNYIGKVDGITGCMVLGDGSIGLILDVDELVGKSEK